MSRHEGVSCDFCSKNNFKEKRFKCLRCSDYDLCLTCYDMGTTVTNHPADHPFQCIVTQADYDLYYGGEPMPRPQSFTCSICGKLGFTETLLVEHAVVDHDDASIEVVCPICVAMPFGDPHAVTDDYAGHLTREHGDTVFVDDFRNQSSRGRRPTRSASSATSRHNFDPLSEILSQLARSRRSQQFRSHVGPGQTERSQLRQQLGRGDQRLEDFIVPVVPPRKSPAQNASGDASKFVLIKQSKNTSGKKVELEKIDENLSARSLFMQQVMLSTICNPSSVNSAQPFNLKSLPRNGSYGHDDLFQKP
ncbi:E3 ubiquitin-protein ligase KCMF1-like [Cimex lectularius]|uniref:RING-type E3 ubiquitin transferase n=1 Tax=Cimex lectularius TaxID=79782 RepID=A0A8I6RVG9_CIMLE|nr:E3 ubiquitin-protein ligase KCMF1-like [Cimex lectularius]